MVYLYLDAEVRKKTQSSTRLFQMSYGTLFSWKPLSEKALVVFIKLGGDYQINLFFIVAYR